MVFHFLTACPSDPQSFHLYPIVDTHWSPIFVLGSPLSIFPQRIYPPWKLCTVSLPLPPRYAFPYFCFTVCKEFSFQISHLLHWLSLRRLNWHFYPYFTSKEKNLGLGELKWLFLNSNLSCSSNIFSCLQNSLIWRFCLYLKLYLNLSISSNWSHSVGSHYWDVFFNSSLFYTSQSIGWVISIVFISYFLYFIPTLYVQYRHPNLRLFSWCLETIASSVCRDLTSKIRAPLLDVTN